MGEHSYLSGHRHGGGFLDRLGEGLLAALRHGLEADDLSRRPGLLQGLDPRVKLGGALALMLMAVSVRSLTVLAALLGLAAGLAVASRVPLARLMRQVWLGVLAFTGLLALPALVLVPGRPLLHLPLLPWPVTLQGLRSAAFLVGRAETTASYGLLLILCTSWPHLLKSLRLFRVPLVLVVILGMTHRYIFLLLQNAAEMVEARRSRSVGPLPPRERRRLAAGAAGDLLGRALHLGAEAHLAMLSRGYGGEVRLLDDFRLRRRDGAALAGLGLALGTAWWWGRP